jgi:hypothetical protein
MMKNILFAFLGALVVPLICTAQQNPLTYTESSIGLSYPEWEGGDSELEFADINGDGHTDIVSIGDHGNPGIQSGEQGIMVFFNNGDGQWSVEMEGDLGYGGIAVGDANNDGFLDVGYGMHHNYSSNDLGDQLIEVALGNGTGSGWAPWDDGLATAGEDWGMFGTDFGDIDNDGDLDIGSNSFGCCNGVQVYLNNLDGTWTHSYGFSGGNSSDIFQFGDINNDGFLDFAAAYENGTVFFGDGTGDFTPMDQNLPPAGSIGRIGVCLGDVDGDGGMDLAFADYNGGVHVYIWNEWDELWENWSEGLPAAGTSQLLQLCDMNADGDMDLASFGEAHFQLWLGDGNGNWTADATFTTQTSGDGHAFRCGGDVDHNGKPDMVILVEIGTWISYQNYLKCYKETSSVFTLNIKPVYPHGHEFFWQNCIRDIKWLSAVPGGVESTVRLEYSVTGNSGPWNLIADNLPNNGHYQWLIPQESSLDCFIRYTVMTENDTTSSVTPAAFTITDGTAAVREKLAAPSFILSPNPATNYITISSHNDLKPLILKKISVLNITGKEVLSAKEKVELPLEINVSDLPSGMYFVRVTGADNSSFTSKFIKK